MNRDLLTLQLSISRHLGTTWGSLSLRNQYPIHPRQSYVQFTMNVVLKLCPNDTRNRVSIERVCSLEKDTFLCPFVFQRSFFGDLREMVAPLPIISLPLSVETNKNRLRDGESQVAEALGSVGAEMRSEEGVVGS
jgi:hypothetical protein